MSLYPKLEPTAPPEQVFRLGEIKEIEATLNKEIIERDALKKKFSRAETGIKIVNTLLTGITVVASAGGIVTASTGIGLPAAITFGSIGVVSAIADIITSRGAKIAMVKAKKHADIALVAQTILDGITSIISKALSDGAISAEEFNIIMLEKKRYFKQKSEIRAKTKKIIQKIREEERQEILEQGRREGRQEVAKKLIEPTAVNT